MFVSVSMLCHVVRRDGYSFRNIIFLPAVNQAKLSSLKILRGDLVVRVLFGFCTRKWLSVHQNKHLVTAGRMVYIQRSG